MPKSWRTDTFMSGMPDTPAWAWAGISIISGSCCRRQPQPLHRIGQDELCIRCGGPLPYASEEGTSDEARLLEIVIGLDDFPQLVLGPLVTPVGVGVMPLHQLLEAGLDPLAVGALIEAERLQRLALQRLQSPRRLRLVTPQLASEKPVRIGKSAGESGLCPDSPVPIARHLCGRARLPRG